MGSLRRVFIFLNILTAAAVKIDSVSEYNSALSDSLASETEKPSLATLHSLNPSVVETYSYKELRQVMRQNTESEITSAGFTTTDAVSATEVSSEVASSEVISSQDASSTVPTTSSTSSTSASTSSTTSESISSTTSSTTEASVTSTTSSSIPTSASSSSTISSTISSTSTFRPGKVNTGTVCFTTTMTSTSDCDVITSNDHRSTRTCTPIEFSRSSCSPNLICTTTLDDDICMETQGIETAGIIIAVVFASLAVFSFGGICVASWRHSRKQKAAAAKEEATSLLRAASKKKHLATGI